MTSLLALPSNPTLLPSSPISGGLTIESDPSENSYENEKPAVEQIYDHIKRCGRQGATAPQISVGTKMPVELVRQLLEDLLDDKRVFKYHEKLSDWYTSEENIPADVVKKAPASGVFRSLQLTQESMKEEAVVKTGSGALDKGVDLNELIQEEYLKSKAAVEPVTEARAPASEPNASFTTRCGKLLATEGKVGQHQNKCKICKALMSGNREEIRKVAKEEVEQYLQKKEEPKSSQPDLSGKQHNDESDKSVPAITNTEPEKKEDLPVEKAPLSTLDQARRNQLVLDGLKPFVAIGSMALAQTIALPLEEVEAALKFLEEVGWAHHFSNDGQITQLWAAGPAQPTFSEALNAMGGTIEGRNIAGVGESGCNIGSPADSFFSPTINFTISPGASSAQLIEALKKELKRDRKEELMTALEDATEDKLECSIVGKECDECDAAKRPCPYKEPVEDVAHQPHYEDSALQPIEIMRLNFSPEMFKGFLLGNVLKYTLRYDKKDGVKDLEKAQVYLGWLVDHEKRAVI